MRCVKDRWIKRVEAINKGVRRFPMTVGCLLGIVCLVFWWISEDKPATLMMGKIYFALGIGALMGITAQIIVEWCKGDKTARNRVYMGALILTLGYFFTLLPAAKIGSGLTIRSTVVAFILVCMTLWIPSYKKEVDFNRTTLSHLRAYATALFYGVVIMVGILAIIGTIDLLLFDIHRKLYAYMITVIWVLFVPFYYLSLLPSFKEEEEKIECPKFVKQLVAHIAIPLVSVYTLVLLMYFLKIIVTFTWPSGQVGPLVLRYVIAGLLIFVLASMLENKWAAFYIEWFPKMLIPIVVMQLISVTIRLKNYGITESRYYVLLFGVFSLMIALGLSFNKITRNHWIAVGATFFALISITPPVDAFTLSKNSQIKRIEHILKNEGLLVNGKIVKQETVSYDTKKEATNILNYLYRSGYTQGIKWLPEDYSTYSDFENVFGFSPTYGSNMEDIRYIKAYRDQYSPVVVADYDVFVKTDVSNYKLEKGIEQVALKLGDKPYKMHISQQFDNEVYIALIDEKGKQVIGTGLDTLVQSLDKEIDQKSEQSTEILSFNVENEGYRMQVIFDSIHCTMGKEKATDFYYDMLVLFGKK